MRSDAYYGQNGSDQKSSVTKNDPPIKRSAVARSIIAADGSVNPNAGKDFQTRPVSSAQAVPTNPGTPARSASGTVPKSLDRAKK